MIRQEPRKLLYHLATPHQLFDPEQNPDELDNRYGCEPAIAQRLEPELRHMCDPEHEGVRIEKFRAAQRAAIARPDTAPMRG